MAREPPAPPHFTPGPRDGLEQLRERKREKNGPDPDLGPWEMPPGGKRVFPLPVRTADPGPDLS